MRSVVKIYTCCSCLEPFIASLPEKVLLTCSYELILSKARNYSLRVTLILKAHSKVDHCLGRLDGSWGSLRKADA